MDEVAVERVLRAVEAIPRGRVAAYGDIGGVVGIGPRQVGWVMQAYGSTVPWWRVTNAAGDLPQALLDEARVAWAREGIAVKPGGHGCRIADHRADLEALARAWELAVADLPRG